MLQRAGCEMAARTPVRCAVVSRDSVRGCSGCGGGVDGLDEGGKSGLTARQALLHQQRRLQKQLENLEQRGRRLEQQVAAARVESAKANVHAPQSPSTSDHAHQQFEHR